MNIGSIRANNTEDPDNRDSIRLGFVTGDGLLGDAVRAICKLVSAVESYGRHRNDEALDDVEEARLNLYDVLKAIEEAAR